MTRSKYKSGKVKLNSRSVATLFAALSDDDLIKYNLIAMQKAESFNGIYPNFPADPVEFP